MKKNEKTMKKVFLKGKIFLQNEKMKKMKKMKKHEKKTEFFF